MATFVGLKLAEMYYKWLGFRGTCCAYQLIDHYNRVIFLWILCLKIPRSILKRFKKKKKTESGPAICFGYAFGGLLVETLILCMWWCLTYEIWINRRTVCQFPGHQGAVRGLTASTDGSTLVSCGTDCT
jgi:hypothetical protein